jgi:hypothetical protein
MGIDEWVIRDRRVRYKVRASALQGIDECVIK